MDEKFETQQIIEDLSISAVTDNSGWFCRNWIFQNVVEFFHLFSLSQTLSALTSFTVRREAEGVHNLAECIG